MTLCTLAYAESLVPNFQQADSAVMQQCVNAADDVLSKWLDRQISLTSYDEIYDGQGGCDLRLNNYPVTEIDQVMFAYQPVIQIRMTNQNVSRASFRMDSNTSTTPATPNNLYLTSVLNGVTTVETIPLSGCVMFQDLANAINAYSSFGWTALALAPYATWPVADLYTPQGAKECRWYGAAFIYHHVWNMYEYTYNQDIGELVSHQGFDFGYRNYRVKYTAGFANVPYALQDACGFLAVSVYNFRGINANLSSENYSGVSWSNIADKNFHSLDIVSRFGLGLYRNFRIPKFRI